VKPIRGQLVHLQLEEAVATRVIWGPGCYLVPWRDGSVLVGATVEDADLESAVNGVMAGIFGASGQSCVAGSRLYLQEAIADRFLDDLTGRAAAIRIGDPLAEETQMGPLATRGQLARIEAEVAKALDQGANLRHGGKQPARPSTAGCKGTIAQRRCWAA
jgi:acyl-CoA reductase-like NAD-dependent aldehyde dehydrogenase